jgi:hypothetical protein
MQLLAVPLNRVGQNTVLRGEMEENETKKKNKQKNRTSC